MKRIDFESAAKRARQEANGAQARAKQAESKASSAKTKVRMAKSALKQARKTLKAARKDAKAAKRELANWREAAASKEDVAMKAEKKALNAQRSRKTQKARPLRTAKSGLHASARSNRPTLKSRSRNLQLRASKENRPPAAVLKRSSSVTRPVSSARSQKGPLPNSTSPLTTPAPSVDAPSLLVGGGSTPDSPG